MQVVGYVPASVKNDLMEIKASSDRLTESALVEKALIIAMPQLRALYGVFPQPTRVAHGRRRNPAA
jgi:hypothetical protein